MESFVDMELVERDLPDAIKYLTDVSTSVNTTNSSVKALLKQVLSGELKTNKGISLFEVKFHSLLSYLINMTLVIQSKVSGKKIEYDPAIFRLAELRTVIEKLKPIEQKLKYHVDKLVKASFGAAGEDDPLRFRANPENLMNKLNVDDDDEGEDDDGSKSNKKSTSGAYVPPKLMAVHYEDDLDKVSRKERQLEGAKKRALSSSILKDLQDEYYDGPEEVQETAHQFRTKESEAVKHRTEYEEQHFVRLNLSKKDKHKEKMQKRDSGWNNITHFTDINVLTNEGEDDDRPKKKPKFDKSGPKNKSKSKKFRIRHKKR